MYEGFSSVCNVIMGGVSPAATTLASWWAVCRISALWSGLSNHQRAWTDEMHTVTLSTTHSPMITHTQWHHHLNTSILQSKLAVESSYQLAVPRCIMGIDSGLEGLSPNCWSTRTHLERNQLVHTWNKQTGECWPAGDDVTDTWNTEGGAYHPLAADFAGGSKEPYRWLRCPVTSALVRPWRGTLTPRRDPERASPGPLPAGRNCLRSG